jgi:hypothetical protein
MGALHCSGTISRTAFYICSVREFWPTLASRWPAIGSTAQSRSHRRYDVSVEFVVRSIAEVPRQGTFVFARAVAAETYFRVTPGSTLGGVPVKPYVDMPFRDLPDGTSDLTCFLFELAESGDERRIRPGMRVALEPGSHCSKHDFMEALIGLSQMKKAKPVHGGEADEIKGPPISDAEIDEIVRQGIRETRPKKPWWRLW